MSCGDRVDAVSVVYEETTGLDLNDVISWNGTNWVPSTIGGGGVPISLDDLTDVQVGTPTEGDILVYNFGSGIWESKDNTFLQLEDTGSSYSGNTGKAVVVNALETGLEFADLTTSFLELSDTPSSYAGVPEYIVRVNAATNALEFVLASAVAGGIDFGDLADTDFTTNVLTVNDIAQWNGTDWVNVSASVFAGDISFGDLGDVDLTGIITGDYITWDGANWISTSPLTFITLSDTPASYTGAANQLVRVNSGETDVEFVDACNVMGGETVGCIGDVIDNGRIADVSEVLVRDDADPTNWVNQNILDAVAGSINEGDCAQSLQIAAGGSAYVITDGVFDPVRERYYVCGLLTTGFVTSALCVWYSDDAINWTRVTKTINTDNERTRCDCIEVNEVGDVLVVAGHGTYRSDDGGLNWTLIASGPDNTDTQFSWAGGALVYANNEFLYVRYSRYNESTDSIYYVGNSDGTSWTNKGSIVNNARFTCAPAYGSNGWVLAGRVEQHGIYVSTDLNSGWSLIADTLDLNIGAAGRMRNLGGTYIYGEHRLIANTDIHRFWTATNPNNASNWNRITIGGDVDTENNLGQCRDFATGKFANDSTVYNIISMDRDDGDGVMLRRPASLGWGTASETQTDWEVVKDCEGTNFFCAERILNAVVDCYYVSLLTSSLTGHQASNQWGNEDQKVSLLPRANEDLSDYNLIGLESGGTCTGDKLIPVGEVRRKLLTIEDVNGFTLLKNHAWNRILLDTSTNTPVTVSTNATTSFEVGEEIEFTLLGSGGITFNPRSGVTINTNDNSRTISVQYQTAVLVYIGDDVWQLEKQSVSQILVNKTFIAPPVFPSYTVSGLPSVTPAAQQLYVTDDIGGAVMAYSDGTNWRRVSDGNIITT